MDTVKVDAKRRVRLPDAKPGQVFAYEVAGEIYTLKPVQPADQLNKGRLIKRGKRILGLTDRPITSEMVKQTLADFP